MRKPGTESRASLGVKQPQTYSVPEAGRIVGLERTQVMMQREEENCPCCGSVAYFVYRARHLTGCSVKHERWGT